jgi:transcription antitermination factor NusG
MDNNNEWFALQVKPRLERNTSRILEEKGFETYLPLSHSRRQWRDRVATVDTALFPGYLFCRFIARNRMPILTTPGVFSIVSLAKLPAPIPDQEIEAIRRLVQSGLNVQPVPYVTEGQRVRIENGPLRDTEGIVISVNKGRRITVSVSLLQRSVAAELSTDTVLTVLDQAPVPLEPRQSNASWMYRAM